MADKVQINIGLTTDTRDALRQACKERGLSQGELVDLALHTFLEPLALSEHLGRLADQQMQMLGQIHEVQTILLELLDALRGERSKEAAASASVEGTPPIATYTQLYGPLTPVPLPDVVDAVGPPRAPRPEKPRRFRRWLSREEPA